MNNCNCDDCSSSEHNQYINVILDPQVDNSNELRYWYESECNECNDLYCSSLEELGKNNLEFRRCKNIHCKNIHTLWNIHCKNIHTLSNIIKGYYSNGYYSKEFPGFKDVGYYFYSSSIDYFIIDNP
jgi:DNA-binding SARP family transcriptional activator